MSIVQLAQRHRRDGVRIIFVKVRQSGQRASYKRVERLYRFERLQVRRGSLKKRDLTARHPLGRPSRRNEVWSMDFVFDCTGEGCTLRCLMVVDDPTHDSDAIILDYSKRELQRHASRRLPERALVCFSRLHPRLYRALAKGIPR